ncbi:GGDEF domain-containing protein [Sulfurospirillum arcachonense]|uniref:GGDEF domain-containing protein n=1 Tax=Sulfurospirillum arcachonense TaxID=57666 RepID=UPI0004692BCC|nr:GGDEF domain-containing protein [Sulfurospirillum arcachonense]
MTKDNNIVKKIIDIGENSFSKLKKLSIPPYPKYYYDTFMDELSHTSDASLIDLSKKYSYLFSMNETEYSINEVSFELAKSSIKEFEKSNTNLKKISDKNFVDISAIKNNYERVYTQDIIDTFNLFQEQVLTELQDADETITKLKLEIERLERESHIDPLTKAYNRRVFTKDIGEILGAVKDKDADMFLIMIDADDFKNINNSYGHIAGDKTLIFLTKLIQSSLRKGVKIYRYGGEEFIIILNRTTLEEAQKSIDRIINEASESKLLYKGHNIHLTISAGLTCYKKGDTPDKIIERADEALYEAKRAGKNCFRVSC